MRSSVLSQNYREYRNVRELAVTAGPHSTPPSCALGVRSGLELAETAGPSTALASLRSGRDDSINSMNFRNGRLRLPSDLARQRYPDYNEGNPIPAVVTCLLFRITIHTCILCRSTFLPSCS